MAKPKTRTPEKVELETRSNTKEGKRTQSFNLEQANNILKSASGSIFWKLPANSKYKFDSKDGLTKIASNRGTEKA